MTLAELRAQRAKLAAEAKSIVEAADQDGRVITADEAERAEEIESSITALDAEASALEGRAATAVRLRAIAGGGGNPGPRTVPATRTSAGAPLQVSDPAEQDPRRGFRSEREFYMEVMEYGRTGRASQRLRPLLAAAGGDEQSTFSDPHGGVFVPVAYSPNISRVAAEADPIGGRVTRIPMAAPTVKFPARVDKNHTSSVSGGFRAYRRAEADTAASSRGEYENITLEANGLFGVAFATEELLSDSPQSFAAIIEAGFRDEFASRLITERLNGTGVGEFLGVLKSPCLISVAKESAQAADTINGTNILKMRKRCWGYGNAVWLANHDTYVQLATAHIAGTNGDVFLFSPARGEDVPDMLLGRPVIFTEYCETLGDLGDLILGNWSEYLDGDYQPLMGDESTHVRFVNHERCFKFTARNAGAPWWRSALTPKKSTETLSPFVALAARA